MRAFLARKNPAADSAQTPATASKAIPMARLRGLLTPYFSGTMETRHEKIAPWLLDLAFASILGAV